MGQSILITGASQGIGAATAQLFLDEGWNVGLLARRTAPMQALAAGRANAAVFGCDVSDPDAVAAAFAAFVERFGRLDVLFNNAGVFAPAGTPDEIPIEDWLRTVGINLNGAFFCARAAFAQMRRQDPQGGRIINNGSISAHVPRPGSAPYTATKHAITGLTRSLSLDGRPHDIACGQIDIGNAASEMALKLAAGTRQADGSMKGEHLMALGDVARAVLHMASLPPGANVQFMTIMATKMPYIGRG